MNSPHPAINFLKVLSPHSDATFNIEHYTDVPKGTPKPSPDPLAGRHANLSILDIQELLPTLEQLNRQGAGIFVARNQFNGHRNKQNISRVLGVHADLDGLSQTDLKRLLDILLPSIVVQSSAQGHYQLYWQLANGETLSVEEAENLNRALVHYGADPAAVDATRLLRLPGFKHMKKRDEGFTPLVAADYSGAVYTAEQLKDKFIAVRNDEPSQRSWSENKRQINTCNTVTVSNSKIELIIDQMMSEVPALWNGRWRDAPRKDGKIGYPSPSEADLALAGHIARFARQAGVDEASLPRFVEDLFSQSGLGASEKWKFRQDYRAATIEEATKISSISRQRQSKPPLLESHGDIRNAKAFARLAKDTFIHITTRGQWLRWQDERWMLCEKQEEQALAKQVCDKILESAQAFFKEDPERGRPLVNDAMLAHRLNRINAMLKLAVSEPGMAITDRELDSNPYFLGVENGVVDLRKGHLILNRPDFYITRFCNAAHNESAQCPRWQQFMTEIFEGDTETIESVQRLMGCTLLGLPNEEILVICYGHGSNGKSVFSNVLHKIMGGYSITAPPSLLTTRRNGDSGPRNDVAALAGARYVSINELQAGDRLDEQIIKQLAGREPISARFLHQEFFEFQPTFTPWLRTNHKPIVVGEEDGIWRRLILLPFMRRFDEHEQDTNLEQTLLDERDGILMWMLAGASQYIDGGLRLSRRIKAEGNQYRSESDMLGEFLADETTIGTTQKVLQQVLYSRYRGWCQESGVKAVSKKSFTQRLKERGFSEGKSGCKRYYLGLSLRLVGVHSGGDEQKGHVGQDI